MAVNLNFGAWVKVARTFCGQAHLTLKWVSEEEIKRVGAQAWTDSRAIYTRRPSQAWTDKQFLLWLYYLLHEIGHNRPGRREVFKVLEKYKPTGLLAYVNNLMEDHVQEHDMMDNEPSLTRRVAKGRAAYYQFLLDEAGTDPERRERARQQPQGPTLFSWDASVRVEFQRDVAGFSEPLLRDVESDPQVREWTEKLNAGDYADVLRDKPDVWGVFELSKRIVAEVFGQDPEGLHDSKGQAGGEGEGEGQPGEGQGQGQGGQGQGKGQGKGEGEGEGKDGKPGEGKGSGSGQEDYADWLLNHNHGADKRAGDQPSAGKKGAGLTISYDKYFASGITGDAFVADFDGLKIYDAVNNPPHNNMRHWGPTPESTLSKRVARYLQAQTRNRKIYGQKKGKLSNRSLYRLKLKGAGEIRKRVFDQRIINKSKDVAVQVLVDLSGSMGNFNKAENAIAAATHLHEVISQQLHIPLEILGFSETSAYSSVPVPGKGIIVTFQEFGKPRTTEVVNEGLRTVMNFNGCNRDGEAILWARERLLRQKTSRRIMIVISDGQPKLGGGLNTADIAAFTREVIQKVEREGLIEMYAIGLKTDSVRHFYTHHRVINNPEQLEEALLGVLKDKILNEVTA